MRRAAPVDPGSWILSRSGAGTGSNTAGAVRAGDMGLGYRDRAVRNLSNKLWTGTMDR